MRYVISCLSVVSVLLAATTHADVGDQRAKLLPDDGAMFDFFGASVGVSDSTAIVGAPSFGPNSSAAYLFDTTTGQQVVKLVAADAAPGDQFGNGVAIDGEVAIVGAFWDDDNGANSGSAYLFDVSDPAHPTQIFKLLPEDGDDGDWFGFSVAISGEIAIVGAFLDDDNGGSGSAYLFDTTTGAQIAKLLPDDGAASDFFGFSVAISGDTAIVGAQNDDDNGINSGSAYLFDTATGVQLLKVLPDDGADGDQFGEAVAIFGDTGVIGAKFDDDNGNASGSAYLFDVASGLQLAKLLPGDGAAADSFGESVATNGHTVIVGADEDGDNGFRSGSAYIFDAETGVEIAKILPTDGEAGNFFGASVAISDATAIVGAPIDNDNGAFSGSAYLFDADTTPPEIVCDLVPVHVEEDEGLFQVVFTVTDNADPDPLAVAVMTCGDLEIEIANGEFVEIELDEECEIEIEHGRVEVEGPNPHLEVFAEDASGNASMCDAAPVFASGDDDRHHGRRRRR